MLERRFPGVLGDRLDHRRRAGPPQEGRPLRLLGSDDRAHHPRRRRPGRHGAGRDVFDWNRLVRYFLGVVACTVGLYLLAAVNIVPAFFLSENDLLRTPAVLGAMALDAYAFFAFSYLIFGRGHTASSSVRYVAPAALFLVVQVVAAVIILVTTPFDEIGPPPSPAC